MVCDSKRYSVQGLTGLLNTSVWDSSQKSFIIYSNLPIVYYLTAANGVKTQCAMWYATLAENVKGYIVRRNLRLRTALETTASKRCIHKCVVWVS